MKDQVAERATTAIATGALTNPHWLPYFEKVLSIGLSSLDIIGLLAQISNQIRNEK